MKKLLGIVVLGLLLVSCRYDGENYGFGKRLTESPVSVSTKEVTDQGKNFKRPVAFVCVSLCFSLNPLKSLSITISHLGFIPSDLLIATNFFWKDIELFFIADEYGKYSTVVSS